MTSNTNNISDQDDDELYEELLYEVLLYKKKDIIAIREKLGMTPLRSINDNTNQTALNESKGKILEDSFRLFFDLVEELVQIVRIKERSDADILPMNPILSIVYRNKQDLVEVTCEGDSITLGEMYHLLLYLEWDISLIRCDLGIVSYTNPKISGLEVADKNARAYLQKFRRSLKRCSKCGNTEIHQ